MVKKKPIFGAIPSLCMPKKSAEIGEKSTARKPRKVIPPPSTPEYLFKSMAEVQQSAKKLESSDGCSVVNKADRCIISVKEESFLLPTYSLVIDDSLGFNISVFGWYLPENHQMYLTHKRSVRNIKIADLLNEVKSFSICPGVTRTDNANNSIMHVIPKEFDPLMEEHKPFPCKEIWRSVHCEILTQQAQQCKVVSQQTIILSLEQQCQKEKSC